VVVSPGNGGWEAIPGIDRSPSPISGKSCIQTENRYTISP
jgi:hypothetical protein